VLLECAHGNEKGNSASIINLIEGESRVHKGGLAIHTCLRLAWAAAAQSLTWSMEQYQTAIEGRLAKERCRIDC
jgi:hypothetical protein